MHEAYKNDNFLNWRARRGMHELDGILVPYVSKFLGQMSLIQRENLASLLDEEDPHLYKWFFTNTSSPGRYESLIRDIKAGRLS